MTKNQHVNRMGMITFLGCMVITAIFFLFIIVIDPGPVDAQEIPPVGLTKEEYVARKEVWIKSTPESIARGEQSYKLNCAFYYQVNSKDSFLEMVKNSELPNKGSELEIFRMLSKGNAELGILKIDHLREDERWDIVHYLRSLNTSLPSTTRSEWKNFFKEGA